MSTGATKNDSGKPVINYIPAEYIEGTAAVFTFGARKYASYNYRKGMQHSRLLDAAFRHLLAIMRGEEIDPESGLPHVYHASCSLAMYDYMRLKFPNLNDVYEQIKEKPKCEPIQNLISETTKSKDSESLQQDKSQLSFNFSKT